MSYGGGANEQLLSRVLATRRDEIVLATKFGIVRDADGVRVDARPVRVQSDLEASLSRLGVEHIDLYYLHRADPAIAIEESIGAMAELVTAGKVHHLGVSELTVTELERAAAVHPIAALQCEWSLAWREIEDDILPTARRLGIGVVPYSPLGRGLLTGAVAERNLALVGAVAELAREHGATPGQLALAWLLARGDVVPIPGTKHRAHLAENLAAADLALSGGDLDRLEAVSPRAAWVGERSSFAAPQTVRSAG